jgi:peptidoglycan hydrolase-like protein with peptidoglycan-binding domain
VADDLDLTEATGDGEMSIRKMTLWIDAEKLVTLKMHMDGRMEQGGQTRDVFVERIDRDYRSVPGCGMYMPYSSVVRMGGVLGPKEQKELEQTRKQLADLDEQLASMPADQRQMMESRMGPQLAMMRRMVEGGAFEVETEVRAIRINTGPEGALASVALPGAPSSTLAAPAPEGEFDLVRTIQRDLERLGYDPGNTDGELTTETAVAISRFQAENGLDVTGEASPQLAGILSAKLAGGRGPSTAQPRSAPDEEALREAREACLQRKVEQARAAEKKKKRFGKLLSSVGRIAGRHGGDDLAADIDRVSRDVYDADATADDLDAAAEALGISRDDVAACQNPG